MELFTNLHSHTYYSIMDGLCSPEELIIRAKELGMPGLAITDHGTLSGNREFQAAGEKHGVKPVLGCEMYFSPTDRFDRRALKVRTDNTQVYNHLVVLAANPTGERNLSALSEKAWREGFYFKPRIDAEILQEHREGLIVLSGCMSGVIAKAVERGDQEEAERVTRWFKDTFDDNFYMEIQPHNPLEINRGLLDLADLYSIKPVVTLDCHFASEEQRAVEEIMLVLSTSPKKNFDADFSESRKMDIFERLNYLYPDRPISFEKFDLYLMDAQEVWRRLQESGVDRIDAITNTNEILDKVTPYEYHQGLSLLPEPKSDPSAMLRKRAQAGLKSRRLEGREGYQERLDHELSAIADKDFSSYFLVVADMIDFAKSKKIRVGPGRGSSAGSLVCYALGITEVDPLKYGLLFERFIDPDRNDFPDIDTDIDASRRNEVKDYLRRKFRNVAGISTYVTFKDKNAIKDVARVFKVPLGEVNAVCKQFDTWDEFISMPNTRDFRARYPEVVRYADMLNGRIRGTGLHAAGIVVSKESINKFAPIEMRKDPQAVIKDERVPTVAYDMEQAADIGLIKLDALGLKTLSVIDEALKFIEERYQRRIDPVTDIPLDDANVFRMLTEGKTLGVFQAEQPAYTKLLMSMGVNSFDEVAVSNALVRPGAMNTIGADYIARKQGKQKVGTVHPILDDITKDTFGCIVYQEQVMQACTRLAGMTGGEANKIRKIIGKKKDASEFDEFKERFVKGASEHISKAHAEKLWSDFEAHAGYSFNKSHAVAYSMVTIWTAWLKYYYPLEYMAALLRNEEKKIVVTQYLIECKRLGLKILLPHINTSEVKFSIQNDHIRFGLENIKYVSDNIGAAIIRHRPFESYGDVVERSTQKGSGINSRAVESLRKIGALTFEDNPRPSDAPIHYYEYLGIPNFPKDSLTPAMRANLNHCEDFGEDGVFVLYGVVADIKRGRGWARIDILDETGLIGVFDSEDTPIRKGDMYVFLIGNNRIQRYIAIEDLSNSQDDPFIRYISEIRSINEDHYYVVDFKQHKTKAGASMAYTVLADTYGTLKRVMVFPKQYSMGLGTMRPGAVVPLTIASTDDGSLYVGGFNVIDKISA